MSFFSENPATMCGRVAVSLAGEELAALLGATDASSYVPTYNVPPSATLPVLRVDPDARQRWIHGFRWGLVPSWSNRPGQTSRTFNARAETAGELPTFRAAYARRRCIVPVSGFFEWRRLERGRAAVFIHDPQHPIVPLAGLWERHREPHNTGEWIGTFTILTRPAFAPLDEVHHRAPVVVPPVAWDTWLDPRERASEEVDALVASFDSTHLVFHDVDPRVGEVGFQGPRCIAPYAQTSLLDE